MGNTYTSEAESSNDLFHHWQAEGEQTFNQAMIKSTLQSFQEQIFFTHDLPTINTLQDSERTMNEGMETIDRSKWVLLP